MKVIQSVERAFKLLQLMDGVEAQGVMELSRQAGLKQPTVHNFLQTLLALGYVEQDPQSSKYSLTDNARFLGWNGYNKRVLMEAARPFAQKLFEEFNETVLLTVPTNNIRITVFAINSSRPLSVRAYPRMDSKFYSSATGRCLLAGMSGEELEAVLNVNDLPMPGEWDSASTRAKLDRELEKIRKKGTALYVHVGIVALGAMINVPDKMVNASLGLFLPESRFCGEMKKRISEAVKDTAAAISKAVAQSV